MFFHAVLANATKLCYTYDDLSRVTKRTVVNLTDNTETVETYTYDAAGNITEDGSAYDTNNRLTMHNYMTVSYDDDGNMLSDGTMNCTFDSANRLTSAAGNAYTYDAENMRIRNVFGQFDTTYTHNTNAKLSQLLVKTTNGVVTKYVYGLGLIGEETNSSFTTYHFDYRGSTVALTNASGTITDMFEYDTYGQLITRTGTTAVIFGYNGRDGVVTDENGLIYMRARYYSPCLQRFVNADVLHGGIADSTSLNRYAYVNGNPVSFVDPLGLAVEERGARKRNEIDPYIRRLAISRGISYEEAMVEYQAQLQAWQNYEKMKDARSLVVMLMSYRTTPLEWIVEYIARPGMEWLQEELAKVDATYSHGLGLSLTFGPYSGGMQIGWAVDTDGNFVIQRTGSFNITVPGSFTLDLAGFIYNTVTGAPSVDKLEGIGGQVGGSVAFPVLGIPLPIVLGGDVNIIPDNKIGEVYYGLTTLIGVSNSAGVEGHVGTGNTTNVDDIDFNVFEVMEGIFSWIMGEE